MERVNKMTEEERAVCAEIDMLTDRLRRRREAMEAARPLAKVLEFRPRTLTDATAAE